MVSLYLLVQNMKILCLIRPFEVKLAALCLFSFNTLRMNDKLDVLKKANKILKVGFCFSPSNHLNNIFECLVPIQGEKYFAI